MAEEIMQEKAQETTQTQTGARRGRPPVEKTFSKEELDAAVQAAVAEAMKKMQPQQTIVQVAQDEYVTLLYLGQFASGTSVVMPTWGTITLPGGTLDVPKKDFLKGLGNATNAALLRKHKILVIDGLTDAERKRFNVAYQDGEVLSQSAFYELLSYPKDKVCAIFEKLCDDHKQLVARMYLTAYFENNDKRVAADTVKALNEISKKVNAKGMFTQILVDIGAKFAQ